jgi:hypothetical protein
MCETRREFKMSRNTYNKDKVEESSEPVKMSRQAKAPSSASDPASNDSSKKPRQYKDKQLKPSQKSGEWTTVVKGKKIRT